MAITVNGQILRNLPEQVSKNTEDILNLQDVSNNYGIRITALEGNAIALATFQDCAFTGTTSFEGPISSNSGFTFSGDGTVGGNFLVTGSSSFTGNVNASGNVAVVGNITGGSIIENMSGYSYQGYVVKENISLNHLYLGCVKNGNKLTITLFSKVTRTGSVLNNFCNAYRIRIPAIVANKLIGVQLGTSVNVISSSVVSYFSDVNAYVSGTIQLLKNGNDLVCNLYNLGNLVENQEYQMRSEITLLLSDSIL